MPRRPLSLSAPSILIALVLLLCLTACAPRVETAAWDEPFDDVGTWQLSTDAAAESRIEDGRLLIHVRQPGQVAWAAAGKRFANFHLTVDAAHVAGPDDNEYGVLLRMDGDQHFYAFSISADGYARVARYADGQWTLLSPDWFPHPAILQGIANNRLDLEARGAEFAFRVNGEQVAAISDAALSSGDVGLYAGAFNEAGVQVAFDNLSVEPLD